MHSGETDGLNLLFLGALGAEADDPNLTTFEDLRILIILQTIGCLSIIRLITETSKG